jgi:hypothetical protein
MQRQQAAAPLRHQTNWNGGAVGTEKAALSALLHDLSRGQGGNINQFRVVDNVLPIVKAQGGNTYCAAMLYEFTNRADRPPEERYFAICYHPSHPDLGVNHWHWHAKPVVMGRPNQSEFFTGPGIEFILEYDHTGDMIDPDCHKHYFFEKPSGISLFPNAYQALFFGLLDPNDDLPFKRMLERLNQMNSDSS